MAEQAKVEEARIKALLEDRADAVRRQDLPAILVSKAAVPTAAATMKAGAKRQLNLLIHSIYNPCRLPTRSSLPRVPPAGTNQPFFSLPVAHASDPLLIVLVGFLDR